MEQRGYVVKDGKIVIKDIEVLLRLYELGRKKIAAREVAAQVSRDESIT